MEKLLFYYGGTIVSSQFLTGDSLDSHRSTNPFFVNNSQQPVTRLRK